MQRPSQTRIVCNSRSVVMMKHELEAPSITCRETRYNSALRNTHNCDSPCQPMTCPTINQNWMLNSQQINTSTNNDQQIQNQITLILNITDSRIIDIKQFWTEFSGFSLENDYLIDKTGFFLLFHITNKCICYAIHRTVFVNMDT